MLPPNSRMWRLLAIATHVLAAIPTVARLSRTNVFKYTGPVEPFQREVLDKAFTDALEMAQVTLQPKGIPPKTADKIFAKYFPASDKAIVMQIFKNIVGATYPRQGNPKFANITVDVANITGVCPPESTEKGRRLFHVTTDGSSTISVCPDFWPYIGNWPEPSCQDVGSIVSHVMNVPGASILHEFTHLNFIQAGAQIIDYGIRPSPGQTFIQIASGPALYTNRYQPGLSKTHSTNYQWFATEMWWAAKCQKTFRDPRDETEAATGTCHGGSCGDL